MGSLLDLSNLISKCTHKSALFYYGREQDAQCRHGIRSYRGWVLASPWPIATGHSANLFCWTHALPRISWMANFGSEAQPYGSSTRPLRNLEVGKQTLGWSPITTYWTKKNLFRLTSGLQRGWRREPAAVSSAGRAGARWAGTYLALHVLIGKYTVDFSSSGTFYSNKIKCYLGKASNTKGVLFPCSVISLIVSLLSVSFSLQCSNWCEPYIFFCLFLQFPSWSPPSELGIEEMSLVEFLVTENQFELVIKQLPLCLKEFLPNLPRGGIEEKFYTSALVAAEAAASPVKTRYHSVYGVYPYWGVH